MEARTRREGAGRSRSHAPNQRMARSTDGTPRRREPSAPIAFFTRTYDEAFALLLEARNYIAYEEAADRAQADLLARLHISFESTRLTARLTQIMAWLFFQKAAHAGKLTRDELAHEACRLSAPPCLFEPPLEAERLPPRLRDLAQRSRRLLVRVARLDSLIGRE